MALDVLVSPGCRGVADDYIERALRPGDVLIDAGAIFEALTGTSTVPSKNPAALRVALGLRTVAIRFARDANLSGLVRTGNGGRASIERLQAEAGGGVKVLQLDRDEACRRVRGLVSASERVEACEVGLARFYDRYVPTPADEVVR